jgi:hypothetical protein
MKEFTKRLTGRLDAANTEPLKAVLVISVANMNAEEELSEI